MRHREAGDAGERELDDRDLTDEADDDDEREADHDAEQRVDQRLPEVVREDDQAGHPDDRRDPGRPEQPLGPGHGRESPFHELAAARKACPAQEESEDDDEEDEELREPAQRGSALVRREPALRRPVDQERLDHADPEAGEARDEERREAGQKRGGQRRHDLERERLRVERDQRRDQHAEPSRDDGGEHGVRDGEAAR